MALADGTTGNIVAVNPSFEQTVHRHLQQLGTSPAEVAASLQAAGVRGRPGESLDCAVARYLNAVVGGERRVRDVNVSESFARVRRRWRTAVTVPLPSGTRAFVREFDHGAFPELVELVGPRQTAT